MCFGRNGYEDAQQPQGSPYEQEGGASSSPSPPPRTLRRIRSRVPVDQCLLPTGIQSTVRPVAEPIVNSVYSSENSKAAHVVCANEAAKEPVDGDHMRRQVSGRDTQQLGQGTGTRTSAGCCVTASEGQPLVTGLPAEAESFIDFPEHQVRQSEDISPSRTDCSTSSFSEGGSLVPSREKLFSPEPRWNDGDRRMLPSVRARMREEAAKRPVAVIDANE